MKIKQICCPDCHSPLDIEGPAERHACPNCGSPYSIRDGIIDFTPDDHFYWGEITQEDMNRVNDRAEQIGWFQSILENVFDKCKRDLSGYLLDQRRIAGLFHYYDPERNGSCLDLGSGWGPLSFGLSRFYQQVYSMDGVYERLRFQAVRASQEGVSNIHILKGSMLKLPLADDSMDVVLVNGLLEWIGLSDDQTDPRTLQIRFLQEVFRVLKPGGKIFIGIENRFGAQLLLGSRDHSGIRFTSLLPRTLAHMLVKYSKRGEKASVFSGAETRYRTLTYSYWGYRQLIHQVGFTHPQIYWARPSYNYPYASGSLDSTGMKSYLKTAEREIDGGFKRSLIKSLQLLPPWLLNPIVETFSPDFLILASKDKPRTGLQERILEKGSSGSFFRVTPKPGTDLKSSFIFASRNGIEKIVDISSKEMDDRTSFSVAEKNGFQGRPVDLGSAGQVRAVAHWLVDFQKRSETERWNSAETESEITSLVQAVKKHTDHPQLLNSLDHFASKYLDHAAHSPIPIVAEHGDLTPDNILITAEGKVQVVQWDHASSAGNPLMDAGAFYFSLFPISSLGNHLRLSQSTKGLIAKFSSVYGQSYDLPLELSPAYYVLRAFTRDVGFSPVNPENYMVNKYWIRLLRTSLEYGVKLGPGNQLRVRLAHE